VVLVEVDLRLVGVILPPLEVTVEGLAKDTALDIIHVHLLWLHLPLLEVMGMDIVVLG